MRVWKIAGGSVAVLGVMALMVAASAPLSGQQRVYVSGGDGQKQRVIVREGGPMAMFRTVGDGGGVRLGVSVRDVAADEVAKLKLTGPSGVVIDDVDKDSPAAKGGVMKGDVAVTFDGETVRSVAQFTRLVRESAAGRAVKMAVMRDGKRVDLSVTPAASDDGDARVWIDEQGIRGDLGRMDKELKDTFEFRMPAPHPDTRMAPMVPGVPMHRFNWDSEGAPFAFSFQAGRGRLGVTVQDLSPELAEFFGVKEGALVASVQKDTPAAKAGFKAGDVITAIDGKAVTTAGNVVDQLREKSGEVSVTVMRDKKALTLKATIEKPEPVKPKMVIQGIPTL